MPTLRQLHRRSAAINAIKPQVGAENLLIPIGPLGLDNYGVAVGRKFSGSNPDRIKKRVEREFWLVLRKNSKCAGHKANEGKRNFVDSHRSQMETEFIQRGNQAKQS